jgi:RHS repeat-associated protein
VRYRGEFDPHGQVVLEVTSGGTGTYANSHKYTGYEREWSTNLDYAKARMFSHNRARFMQPDPLGLGAAELTAPQTLNQYSYVANDPVNFVDPSGLFLIQLCGSYDWGYCDDTGCHTISQQVCILVDTGGWTGPIGPYDPPQGGGGGGGGGPQNPEPQQPPAQPPPLHCQQNIINAMRSAWQRSGNGTRNTEAGFLAYRGRDGQIGTANLPNTNQDRRISFRLSDVLPQGATLTAIFHTHPNSGSATPSTGDPPSDVATANRLRVPIYVISNRGLNVYDPATRQTTELRDNIEWQRPCRE